MDSHTLLPSTPAERFGDTAERVWPAVAIAGIAVAFLAVSAWAWIPAVLFTLAAAALTGVEHAETHVAAEPARGECVALAGVAGGCAVLVGAALDAVWWALSHAVTGAGWVAGQVATSAPVRLVTTPVWHWLRIHGQHLPVSPTELALLWGAGAAVLFILAMLRSRGAMIGFILIGAGTAFMAWHGTLIAAHRPVAVGAVALAWALLAVLALRRGPASPATVIVEHTEKAG